MELILNAFGFAEVHVVGKAANTMRPNQVEQPLPQAIDSFVGYLAVPPDARLGNSGAQLAIVAIDRKVGQPLEGLM